MIDIKELLKTLSTIPKNNSLYLIEKLSTGIGLFALNGNIVYIVNNREHCSSLSIKTDFLNLETNVFLSAFNSSATTFENDYYNSVELIISNDAEVESNLNAFLNLCLAHVTYMHGDEFISFFNSLVALFKLPQEQHYKNLIGLIGELLFIEYIYNEYKIDLSMNWHIDGSNSQLDFICPFANFEIKTTSNNSLQFTIKHNQLFKNSKNTYLVSVIIYETNYGRTLNEIISNLQENSNYCNSMHFSVNIEKEKRRISPFDLTTKRFCLEKIYVYDTEVINQFKNIPDCVEDLSYKLNLLSFSNISFDYIIPK